MHRCGCFEADLGIESGNQQIQHSIKKGLRLDQVKSVIAALHAHDVASKGFFILGFPGETYAQLEDTINFAVELKSLGLNDVAFFPAMPFPGTQLAEAAKAITGEQVLQGAVMDENMIRDRSFASHRLRKYSAKPEVSVNDNFTSDELRILAKFAYEHFETSQRVEDLQNEFKDYLREEEMLIYGSH
jgi:radical SAM superfamily enzyme YgiQ (UPF0313 family)